MIRNINLLYKYMYNVHEILNPSKFMLMMVQLVLSINIAWTKDDNIYSEISYLLSKDSTEYIGTYNS